MTLSYHDAPALDGRRFVRWLEETQLGHCASSPNVVGSTMARRIRRWRSGGHASFELVDEVLNHFDIHPYALPDNLFVSALKTQKVNR